MQSTPLINLKSHFLSLFLAFKNEHTYCVYNGANILLIFKWIIKNEEGKRRTEN